jgi:hypothetical protein
MPDISPPQPSRLASMINRVVFSGLREPREVNWTSPRMVDTQLRV